MPRLFVRGLLAAAAVAAGGLGVAASAQAISDQYLVHNMVGSDARFVTADRYDARLVNPWGLVASATSPWWPANNGSDTSTITPANNVPNATQVTVPSPTGIVFGGVAGNWILNGAGANFIFASENGGIYGRTNAAAAIAGVAPPADADHPIYKGLAIAGTGTAQKLYATDFHNGKVDVFDNAWHAVNLGAGTFTDPNLPAGYAPYGIQTTGSRIFVSYAQQDPDREDEIPGAGKGYVDAYSFAGALLGRVATTGTLNAPWGLAQAPSNFGQFSGDYLVGNFGDGRISAYKEGAANTWTPDGTLQAAGGGPLSIPGLWALEFGNGSLNANGTTNTLYFTAGPFGETQGLFGRIVASDPLNVSATVPAQLSLTLGPAASFGAFTAGVAKDYLASTTANVISTAGDATLSVADPSTTATGHLVNGTFSLPQAVQANATSAGGTGNANYAPVSGTPTTLVTYAGPLSNDAVTIGFKQTIGANDALRTGNYSKTLTFTLSTTTP